MATSNQRAQESRWLARKAIRRAIMHLVRAEEADDSNGFPQSAVSHIAQAMNECKKSERHYQRAITEMKKNQKELQRMPILSAKEAEKQRATCISCRFFMPYNDGDQEGRCCLETITHCMYTRGSENACNEYRERKDQK